MRTFAVALATILLMCLTSGAHAQRKNCCGPDQWEARAGFEQDYVRLNDDENAVEENDIDNRKEAGFVDGAITRMSVDFKINKVAVQEIVSTSEGQHYNITAILDYGSRTMYVAYWKEKRCQKLPVPPGSMHRCIPANWTRTGTLKIGFGKNAMSVDHYVSPAGDPIFASVLVTSDKCVPVTVYFRLGGSVPTVTSMLYFDVTAGIKDRHIFDLPPFCHKAEESEGEPQMSLTAKQLIKRFA